MNTIIINKLVIAFTLLLTPIAFSKDLGFRFKDGKCVDGNGQTGLNPGFFGQCADLKGVVLGRFNLDDYDFSGSDFTGSDLQKSTLNRATLEKVNFESANLAGVVFSEAKIKNSNFTKANLKNSILSEASAETCNFSKADFSGLDLSYFAAKGSTFTEAKFVGSKLEDIDFSAADMSAANFTNARANGANFSKSTLTKANFQGAKLEKANFTGATGESAIFKKASITNATFTNASFNKASFRSSDLEDIKAKNANLSEADLRSTNLANATLEQTNMKAAMYNRKTTLPMTKERAEELGMVFANSGNVLIVWDNKVDEVESLKKAMEEEGMEVTYSKNIEYQFDGAELKNGDIDTVIHLNGDTYGSSMPEASQLALIEFVKNGGTFIHGELNGYETDNVAMGTMRELSLFPYSGSTGQFDFSIVTGKSSHPLLEGITGTISLNAPIFTNSSVRAFADGAAEVVMKSSGGGDAVAWRKVGQGTVVGFAFGCTYTGSGIPNCLGDKTVKKLYINAVNFGIQ